MVTQVFQLCKTVGPETNYVDYKCKHFVFHLQYSVLIEIPSPTYDMKISLNKIYG